MDKLDSLLPTSVTNNTVNATQNESHDRLSISQSMGNNQVEPTRLNPQFSDRKFNLVIYGKHDMDSSVTILTKINDSINSTSIRDCFRLGKYKQNQSRPRPILLKLNCAMDVATILSNRSSIAYIVQFQKWKKMMDLFSSTFGSFNITFDKFG